jgi:hypothetical protein
VALLIAEREGSSPGGFFSPDESDHDGNGSPTRTPLVLFSQPAELRLPTGGVVVTIAMPPTVQPEGGRAVFFVVEPDRAQLSELVKRVRTDG